MNRYLKLYYGSTHLSTFALFLRLAVVFFVIKRLHNDYFLVNAVFAAGALAYGLGALTVARVSDQYERRICAAGGLVAVAAASIILILGGPEKSYFFLYVIVSGFGFSVFFPAMEGILAERTSKGIELGRSLSRYNFSWSSGDFLGGLAAAWLIDGLTDSTLQLLQVALGLGVLIDLANVGLLFVVCRIDTLNSLKGDLEEEEGEPLPTDGALRRLPRFSLAARWGLFFASAAMTIGLTNFPKYAQDHGLRL